MDITTFSQMIGTLGFPIAACCVMFYQNSKLQGTLTELVTTLQKMNDRIDNIEDMIRAVKESDNEN